MTAKNYYTGLELLSEIPDYNYVGYIWMSNSDHPKPIESKNKIPATTNPYVVEGNLYCEDKEISISIKNTGEGYIIGQIDLKKANLDKTIELKPQTYISHRLHKSKKVNFKQAWIAEKDEMCEGMKVLQPAWRAFEGFDQAIEHKNKEK